MRVLLTSLCTHSSILFTHPLCHLHYFPVECLYQLTQTVKLVVCFIGHFLWDLIVRLTSLNIYDLQIGASSCLWIPTSFRRPHALGPYCGGLNLAQPPTSHAVGSGIHGVGFDGDVITVDFGARKFGPLLHKVIMSLSASSEENQLSPGSIGISHYHTSSTLFNGCGVRSSYHYLLRRLQPERRMSGSPGFVFPHLATLAPS